MAQKKELTYFVVDAFTESAFRGNPATVCFLGDQNEIDNARLLSLAVEFGTPATCFVSPSTGSAFCLRWFSSAVEMDICGHATLATAHILFSSGLVDTETIEFSTRSGILTAKRISDHNGESEIPFSIELNLPLAPTYDYSPKDISLFSKALNGATVVDIKASTLDYTIVELPSWESVVELQPRPDDISECPEKVVVVTAAAPAGSTYDFCSRIFAPKLGIDEDPVCGSAHCALAHYWSLKMNKSHFVAYVASRRSGKLRVCLDKEKDRVLLQGKAVTVMEGRVFC